MTFRLWTHVFIFNIQNKNNLLRWVEQFYCCHYCTFVVIKISECKPYFRTRLMSAYTSKGWNINKWVPLTLQSLVDFSEGGVSLVPKRGCLLMLAYYAFPRWYEFWGRRYIDILTGENRRTRRKTCSVAILSTTNPTWIDPGANPGLRGERPATNDLSHGTALSLVVNVGLYPSYINRVCVWVFVCFILF
jgi:hypothetical protein